MNRVAALGFIGFPRLTRNHWTIVAGGRRRLDLWLIYVDILYHDVSTVGWSSSNLEVGLSIQGWSWTCLCNVSGPWIRGRTSVADDFISNLAWFLKNLKSSEVSTALTILWFIIMAISHSNPWFKISFSPWRTAFVMGFQAHFQTHLAWEVSTGSSQKCLRWKGQQSSDGFSVASSHCLNKVMIEYDRSW